MFNTLRQIASISGMNLRSIPQRLGPSSVIVVGIAGVVAVLVALLAMAQGFEKTLAGAGRADRAIVMRDGSNTELSSGVTVEQVNVISNAPGVRKANGRPLASPELYLVADVPKRATGLTANLPLRGVTAQAFDLRDDLTIVQGRRFEPGRRELIAGQAAASQFENLSVGSQLRFRDSEWRVVGIFASGGDANESEVWTDLAVVQATFKRQGAVSSVRVQLDHSDSLQKFKDALTADPRLTARAQRETDYYAEQSAGLATLITGFGYAVTFIMAIGAVFAALNTMYAAVSGRSVEIATLRALGFGSGPVVCSVLIEALCLALLGGVIGGGLAYLVFNGYTVSTLNSASFSQVSFNFIVSPALLGQGLLWACIIGFFGGLFPALRAARLPITVVLRGL